MSYADIIKKRKKEWECDGLMDGKNHGRGEKLPFSSPLMNWCTYGGIPRDMITEFFGAPSGGKSTTAVDICKNAIDIFTKEYDDQLQELQAQLSSGDKSASSKISDLEDRGPKKVLYIDIEHSFDDMWSKKLGIADSAIDVMQPPDVPAEEILETVLEIIQTGEVGLIVLDSIPSLVPQTDLDKKIGEKTVASLAGLLNIFFRKCVSLLTRYGCTLLTINQIRDNLSNPYVVNTPGGQAPKFYAALRIQFRLGNPVDFLGNQIPQKVDSPAGYIVDAQIVKQKSAPRDRNHGSYYLMFSSGIRPDFDYVMLAFEKYGIIQKSGSWFTLCNPNTGEVVIDPNTSTPAKLHGLAKVYDYIAEHPDYYEDLKSYIWNDINRSGDADENN